MELVKSILLGNDTYKMDFDQHKNRKNRRQRRKKKQEEKELNTEQCSCAQVQVAQIHCNQHLTRNRKNKIIIHEREETKRREKRRKKNMPESRIKRRRPIQ